MFIGATKRRNANSVDEIESLKHHYSSFESSDENAKPVDSTIPPVLIQRYHREEKQEKEEKQKIYAALVEVYGDDCPSAATVYRWSAKEEWIPSPRNEAREEGINNSDS